MPVPSLVTDLSTTQASNYPAGSDNVFPSLDDTLRALSAFIASIRDNSGNGWVSPYLTVANPSYTGTLTGGTGVVNLGSGQFYKDASGNLGIGSTAPVATLELRNAGFYPRMAFTKTSTGAWYVGGEGSGAGSSFQINLNLNNAVTIDSALNVGIGGAPSVKLDVRDASAATVQARTTTSGNASLIATTAAGGTAVLELTNAAGSHFIYGGVGGTQNLSFVVGSERARITSAGDLLVGTGVASGSGIVVGGGKGIFCASSDNGTIGSITTDNAGLTNLTSYRATGGVITFVTANTSGSNTERARIDSSGNLLITGVGGLGYGTGSGGAVTQTTSRTTGVTLNKTNGSITLVSAAGTTSWQSFVVNNSTVAATDTVIVNQKSGADKYLISVTGVNAGSFAITFATTGGTTTEQPVFNFAVIKAVTA